MAGILGQRSPLRRRRLTGRIYTRSPSPQTAEGRATRTTPNTTTTSAGAFSLTAPATRTSWGSRCAMSDERDRVDWLAALVTGYNHYPETFGDDWPRELAESLACHLWPWSKRQRVPEPIPEPIEKTCPQCGQGPMELRRRGAKPVREILECTSCGWPSQVYC